MNVLVERTGVNWWTRLKAWWCHRTGRTYIQVELKCPVCQKWVEPGRDSWTLWEGALYHSICLGWDKRECEHDHHLS